MKNLADLADLADMCPTMLSLYLIQIPRFSLTQRACHFLSMPYGTLHSSNYIMFWIRIRNVFGLPDPDPLLFLRIWILTFFIEVELSEINALKIKL